MRLIDEEGKQIGIVSKIEALQKAKELGLDVVEIAPNADPPVAKLIDFKKFKYQEAKKEREQKKKQKNVSVKEVRLRPFTGDHDFQTMLKRGREFIAEGNQLRIRVRFRGRELRRTDFGRDTMKRFITELGGVKVVREPMMMGRQLVAMVVPDKEKQDKAGEDNEQS